MGIPKGQHQDMSKRYVYNLTCSVCGKGFKAVRGDADTCGPACRQKKRRRGN